MIPRRYQVKSTRRHFISTRYKGIPSQQYKTPVLQYKIQGATESTVQDATSSVPDTRGYQVNRTRRQFFNTKYKGLSSQQYKTPVLQYRIQGDTKLIVQDANFSIQDTRGYQANSRRHWNSCTTKYNLGTRNANADNVCLSSDQCEGTARRLEVLRAQQC